MRPAGVLSWAVLPANPLYLEVPTPLEFGTYKASVSEGVHLGPTPGAAFPFRPSSGPPAEA